MKTKADSNYTFKVLREKLNRADGTDTEHDALYREDTAEMLGVVSRKYQLVEHRDAVKFVNNVLSKTAFATSSPDVHMSAQGKRMDYKLTIENKPFSVKKGDVFRPTITLRNSYDALRSFTLSFGVFRLVCSNGAVVLQNRYSTRLTHAFGHINLDELGRKVADRIDETISTVQTVSQSLFNEEGMPFLRQLLDAETLPVAVQLTIVKKLEAFLFVEETSDGLVVEYTRVRQSFSAYQFWNVLTETSTHGLRGFHTRQKMDSLIADTFFSKPV